MNKEDLIFECKNRFISLSGKETFSDLLCLLKNNSYSNRNISSNQRLLKFLNGHSLCFPFNRLQKEEIYNIFYDESWTIEPKFYGNRVFITYTKENGFKFFSRAIDDDYLFKDITSKIFFSDKYSLINENMLKIDAPFVLDGMVVSFKIKSKPKNDRYLGLEDNFVSYIVGLDENESKKIQQKYCTFDIVAFDVLRVKNVSFLSTSFKKRREVLKKIVSGSLGEELPFIIPESYNSNKMEKLISFIESGFEGGVFKNSETGYSQMSRDKNSMVKIKRNYIDFKNDVDAFISGFSDNKIIFSTYIKTQSGEMIESQIGTSKIPENLKKVIGKDIIYSDTFGDFLLYPEYFGKVFTVSVGGYNENKKEFNKMKVYWRRGIRSDKTRFDCVIDSNIVGVDLLKKILK